MIKKMIKKLSSWLSVLWTDLPGVLSEKNIAILDSFMNNGEHLKPVSKRSPDFNTLLERIWENGAIQDAVKKILTMLLPLLNPKNNFGTDLFNVMSPYWWTPAIEGVAIRKHPKTKKLQVFLARRAADESAYPNKLHCPGTGLRSADAFKLAPETQFDRLRKIEGFNASDYKFIGLKYTPEEERGPYVSLVYLVDPSGLQEIAESRWYDWETIKNDPTLVCHHRDSIIPMAIEVFLKEEKI